MKNKNILAMVLATSMLVPSNAYALSKSDFSDFPNDWSTPALTNAVENGLLVGANGKINASSFITRAEVSAIINRAFGAKKTSSLSSYRDVSSNAWYYNDMSKAVYMETFVGSDGLLNPEKNITREEAFSVIARAFLIDDGDYSELSKFNDGNNVSDWAKKSISGLIKKGYINGSNGNINPKSNITRAEFAQIMYAVAGSYISSPGEYSNNINGNLVVSSDNVVLKNSTIEGDLIITDGVDTGKIQLDSVSVKGRIVIRGGNIINITGKTSTGDIIVQNKNSDTEINVDKDSSVGNILYKTETKVTGEGKVGNITNLISNIEDEKTPTTNKPSGGSSSGGGGSSSSYTTYSVSNWQELKSAAKNAKSGDTIKLKDNITDAGSDTTVLDGVSSATLTISKKNITFDGNNKTITVAEGKTFCFDIDGLAGTTTGVAVKDLTIDGGSFSTKLGGAFFVEDGAEATFENVTFKNCKADSKSSVNGGGAIFINDHGQIPPKVTVKNCTFENNTVPSNDGSFTGRGGAIYANNFRATTPMVLTVTNSTFKNNCAAYGGAIAVDGIVDIKVTGCTFENNNSTVGGDDVYIYEGISSGKKNFSITSKVNATLSDNTYTNKSDSESNMNEMNVIFSRYYPSDFTGDMTTKAPEGAKDLTFKDIERTEVITADTEIPMNSISIEGKTYYYGVPVYVGGSLNTNFTVNGEKVTSEKIGDTNIYCYCSDKLTGDLYGTAEVPYADFYYGELNSVSEPSSNIVTKSDTAQSMRGEGLYDAVTSATTSKWGMYSNTFYEANSDGAGGKILGVKTPIKLPADLYAKTVILKNAKVTCENKLISIVDSITDLSSTPSNQFKTLYANGTLSEIDSSNSQLTTSSNVSATITDQTNYGNYQINVSDLPSEVNGRENVMGVIIETSDGAKYGLKHLENIWFKAGELAIAAQEGISTHGNDISYERYKDIQGKTITKVTYILNEYKNLTIDNLNLYCGKLLGEEYSVTAENVQYSPNKEMSVKLTLNLPEGYEPKISLRKGRTDLKHDTDYTYNPENSTITIKNTKNISPAVYTVIVSDNAENGYVSTKTTFTLNSSLLEKDIKFENNKLVITGDSGVTIDEYRNAITEIYVNDSSIRGAKGTYVINKDGSINFDAKASSHGSTTPIFPDGADGSYTLKLVASGYPTVTGTVGNGSVTPEPSTITKTSNPVAVEYGYNVTATVTAKDGTITDVSWEHTDSGSNSNWTTMFENEKETFFNKFIGLTKENAISIMDSLKLVPGDKENNIDAVSGATYTSKAVRDAIKNAYEQILSEGGEVIAPSAPTISASDFRTKLMYSANGNAELTVLYDEDCEVIYTTNGSEPSTTNGTKVEGNTISIQPSSNSDSTVILKAIAVKDDVYSDVTTTEIEFVEIPEINTGIRVYEGTENCPGAVNSPYDIKIKVTTLNGKIQKIDDMGTETTDIRDSIYWKKLFPRTSGKSITDMLEGMTLEDILSAKTTPDKEDFNTDAVSGATISSNSVKYAIVKAVKSEPILSTEDTVMTPVINAKWGYVTDAKNAGLEISVEAASNVTIRYTTDGTEPSETSQEMTRLYGKISKTFYGENENGTKMPLKIAAFDSEGNKSKTVTTWLVFAKPNETVEYNSGTYEGNCENITASVGIGFSYYGSNDLIKSITISSSSENEYSEFIDELLAEVYYKQSANIDDIELVSGQDRTIQENILKAIDAALKKAIVNNEVLNINSLLDENKELVDDTMISEDEKLDADTVVSENEKLDADTVVSEDEELDTNTVNIIIDAENINSLLKTNIDNSNI